MKQTTLRVGAGKAILRFPDAYFPHEGFAGAHDDIHLRILLIEQLQCGAIISVELPSVRPFSLIDELRVFAGDLLEVPAERVWFVVTHNMAGPHVPKIEDVNGAEKREMHLNAIRKAIEEAAVQAKANLQPARFGAGSGFCDVNGNRDIPSKEGWWLGINAPGPSDKTLSVLRFDGLDGTPIAILFHYAVKSAVIDDEVMSDGFRYYSSELTGKACLQVEVDTGATAFYFMGAAGDQVPKKMAKYSETDSDGYLIQVHHRELGYLWAAELGQELGTQVLAIADKIRCAANPPAFIMDSVKMTFEGQHSVPSQWANVPVKHYDYISKAPTELEVSLLQLGDVVLIGVKPEFTCITGIQLREVSPFLHTLLIAMVNGGQGYMADRVAYERVTYEATHSEFACGGAEAFVERMGPVLMQCKAAAASTD